MFFSLLKRLFSKKPSWAGSPEGFLALVMEIQAMNNSEFSESEIRQLGQIMQKVINVDISPYKDFDDLMSNASPDFKMIVEIREKMKEHTNRVDLKKAIYGKDADLGDDDVMKSNDKGSVFARKFIDEFSKHVEFKKDDESDK